MMNGYGAGRQDVSGGTKVLMWAIGVAAVLLILMLFVIRLKTVLGHEVAIKETFNGIEMTSDPGQPAVAREYTQGKYFYCPALADFVVYDMRKHRFILDDEKNVAPDDKDEINGGPLMIQVQRGQAVKVRLKVVWRYQPSRIGTVHRQVRNDRVLAEAKVLDVPIRKVAQNLITPMEALEVYTGAKLVELQKLFLQTLQAEKAITDMGLVIDDAVLYTDLDPTYVQQINAKIVAEQKELAQKQVEKANLAEAEAEKARAEIAKNQRIVAAEAAKQEEILKAEAANKQVILKAEADKQQVVLAAEADMQKQKLDGEGLKLRKVAEADGVRALKLAEAAGEEALKLAKYDGVAGERQTSVMIAEKIAERVSGMLKGVQVIPENAFVSLSDGMGAQKIQPVVDVKK